MIFLDGVMPGIDGIEVTRAIRRMEGQKRRVPIVMVAGDPRRISEEKCREAGVDEYLRKPIGIKALKIAARKWAHSESPELKASSSDPQSRPD